MTYEEVKQMVEQALLNTGKHFMVAGNWKMNMTVQEGRNFLSEIGTIVSPNDILIFPPMLTLGALSEDMRKQGIHCGPQNINELDHGAYTGEISLPMVLETASDFALIGHSERRSYYNETDTAINAKAHAGLKNGLNMMICIGENLEERKTGRWKIVLQNQIQSDLFMMTKEDLQHIYLAYEPVWAIGTGESASVEQVQETHAFIKEVLQNQLHQDVPVLYGGSVNEKNAKALYQVDGVDGFLIGGASLKANSFKKIIELAG